MTHKVNHYKEESVPHTTINSS